MVAVVDPRPLSEVSTTIVLEAAPFFSSALSTSPTLQSISIITSSYSPCSLLPLNLSETKSGTCGMEWAR